MLEKRVSFLVIDPSFDNAAESLQKTKNKSFWVGAYWTGRSIGSGCLIKKQRNKTTKVSCKFQKSFFFSLVQISVQL